MVMCVLGWVGKGKRKVLEPWVGISAVLRVITANIWSPNCPVQHQDGFGPIPAVPWVPSWEWHKGCASPGAFCRSGTFSRAGA